MTADPFWPEILREYEAGPRRDEEIRAKVYATFPIEVPAGPATEDH